MPATKIKLTGPWADAPVEYDDPYWQDLARKAAAKHGVPEELALGILLRGERTNADLVSSEGARTPFQFVPGTRKRFIETYKIDPWASPEASAEAAALHLKESLTRHSDKSPNERAILAAAEYYGGPNWAKAHPEALDYSIRVNTFTTPLGQQTAQGFFPGAPPAGEAETTSPEEDVANAFAQGSKILDEVRGIDIATQKQSIKQGQSEAFQAYSRYAKGQMADDERAQYESAVRDGSMPLPNGVRPDKLVFGIAATGGPQRQMPMASQTAQAKYLAALSGDPSGMPPEQMAEFESGVARGTFAVPEGFPLRGQGVAQVAQQPQAAPQQGEQGQRPAIPAAQQQGQQAAPQEDSETSLAGLTGAFARGVAPYAVPAGVGMMVAGPAGAAVGGGLAAGADMLVGLANLVTGRDFTSPTSAAEAILTRLGVAQPKTAAEKLVQAGTGGLANALAGAGGAGALAKALPAGGRAASFAAKMAEGPAQQAVMGATGGLGGEGAGMLAQDMGATPGQEAAARFMGSLAGSSAGSSAMRNVAMADVTRASKSPLRQQQQQTIQAAEAAGIPLMTRNLYPSNNKTYLRKRYEQFSDAIPFIGTGGIKADQQEVAQNVARAMLEDLGAAGSTGAIDSLTASVARDLADTRKMKVDGLVAKKNAVIDRVAKRYVGPVDLSATEAAVQEQIKELSKYGGSAPKKAEKYLTEFLDKAKAQPLNIVEDQRKNLGRQLSNKKKYADIKEVTDKAKANIYSAFRDDMEAHISQYGTKADLKAWKKANRDLSYLSQDLRDFQVLAKAINAGDIRTKDFVNMVKSQEPQVVAKLHENLSPQGTSNMKALIASRVADAAGGLDKMTPAKFLTQTQKAARQFGVVLSRDELKRLEGAQRAISAVLSFDPQNGLQNAPLVAASGLVAKLGAAATTGLAVTGAMLARAFESPTVQKLVANAPTYTPGSKQELEWAKKVVIAMEEAARVGNKKDE